MQKEKHFHSLTEKKGQIINTDRLKPTLMVESPLAKVSAEKTLIDCDPKNETVHDLVEKVDFLVDCF